MSTALAVKAVMEETGMTQRSLARALHRSPSSVCEWLGRTRQRNADTVRDVALALDDPRVYLAAVEELVGIPLAQWWDGDQIDPHRLAILHSLQREQGEAREALSRLLPVMAKPPTAITVEEREQIWNDLHELADVVTALINAIGRTCLDYRFSFRKLFTEQHYRRVEQRHIQLRAS